MKKFLIIFLSLVLMIVCVGCGSYNPPIYVENPNGGTTGGSGGSGGSGGGNTDTPPDDDKDIPDKPNTPAEEVFTFTVTLYETDGRGRESRFYPSAEQNVQVQWMGDGSAATAWFDLTGVATYTGLDGDYRVTLSKLPTDSLGNQTHTYNPNGITASNNNRDIKIVLIPIRTHVSGTGTSSSNPFFIQSEGAYQVVLNTGSGASSQRWFRYIPQEPGIYTIETLVDADANEINPTIRYYMSNMGGWVSTTPEVYPDGGYTNGGFTKNAKYEVYISGEDDAINEVGAPRLFTISAESIIGYPVRVYFSITFTPLTSD